MVHVAFAGTAVVLKTVQGTREQERGALLRQCAAQGIWAGVAWGEPGEAPRANLRRLLHMGIESGKPWLMHLEDDAYLAPDFTERVGVCLCSISECMWTFYSARKEDEAALAAGRLFRRVSPGAFANSQCVVLPASHLPEVLHYLPQWEAEHLEHRSAVDYFLGAYCGRVGLPIYAAVPPAVQHREVPSLLGHRARYGRVSRAFAACYGPTPTPEETCTSPGPTS